MLSLSHTHLGGARSPVLTVNTASCIAQHTSPLHLTTVSSLTQRAEVTLERQACWAPTNPKTTASCGPGNYALEKEGALLKQLSQTPDLRCSEKNPSENATAVSGRDPPHQIMSTALDVLSPSPQGLTKSCRPQWSRTNKNGPHQQYRLEYFLKGSSTCCAPLSSHLL